MFHRGKRKAFTLIELIVVIVILGLLAALAVPTFKSVINDAQLRTDMASVQAAARNQIANAAFEQGAFTSGVIEDTLSETNKWSPVGAKPAKFGEINYAVKDDGSLVMTTISSSGEKCITAVASGTVANVTASDIDDVTCIAATTGSPGGPSTPGGGNPPTTPGVTIPDDTSAGFFAATYSTAGACETITLPLGETGPGTINWGDGTTSDLQTSVPHTYAEPGVDRTIIVEGKFNSIAYFYGVESISCLLSVDAWEDTGVTDLTFAFATANNLKSLPQLPSTVTNLTGAFAAGGSNSFSISNWNVSNVENMNSLFANNTAFNQTLNSWNVSNVKDMGAMFSGATAFNGNISSWTPASAIDMNSMFKGASAFNQNIGNWQLPNVTNFEAMFQNASAFNRPIVNWDTASATNMTEMFKGASSFNSSVAGLKTDRVSSMRSMFEDASAFNQSLNHFKLDLATDMSYMFNSFTLAMAFNGDVSSWTPGSNVNMSRMFGGTSAFNQDISHWASQPTG